MVGYEEVRGCIPQSNAVKATFPPRKRGGFVDGPFTVCPAIPSPIMGEVDHGLWTAWVTVTGPCSRSRPKAHVFYWISCDLSNFSRRESLGLQSRRRRLLPLLLLLQQVQLRKNRQQPQQVQQQQGQQQRLP